MKTSEEPNSEAGYRTPEEFFEANKTALEEDYFQLWDFAKDKIDTVKYQILSSKSYDFKGKKIFSIRVSGQSSEPWSYSEKILVGNESGEVILDMDFVQIEPELKIPECGVPNYFIDSLTSIVIGEHELFAIGYTAKFEPCCGQSEEQRTELLVHTGSKKVEPIELYYWNHSNGTCIEEEPEVTRRSNIRNTGNSLIVERTIGIAGQKSEVETFEYTYNGNALNKK